MQLVRLFLVAGEGAVDAGCRFFAGYPITPASEIAHAAALHFPALGGVFIQAESEVAAVNMVYGSAGMGVRTMTASSSPGFSLKQEGLSYCAGAELPCVVVNIVRGGPGLGNIAPEQADYFQITKGGGHGNYRLITLAPNGAQEMCDLTMKAFELADEYRNPACIMADGITGQMMEVVDIPAAVPPLLPLSTTRNVDPLHPPPPPPPPPPEGYSDADRRTRRSSSGCPCHRRTVHSAAHNQGSAVDVPTVAR